MRYEVGNEIWTLFKNVLEMDYMIHLELLGMSSHSRDLGMNSHSFLLKHAFCRSLAKKKACRSRGNDPFVREDMSSPATHT